MLIVACCPRLITPVHFLGHQTNSPVSLVLAALAGSSSLYASVRKKEKAQGKLATRHLGRWAGWALLAVVLLVIAAAILL